MMHQFLTESMVLEGDSKWKDSSSLCRLFLQFDEWPNSPDQCNPASPEQCDPGGPEQSDPASLELCGPASPELFDPVGVESVLMRYLEQEERTTRDAANKIQVFTEDDQRQLELLDVPPQEFVLLWDLADVDTEDDMQTTCDFSKGEFLELKDLYDPESSSTSSDNSSLTSMNFDDCFDAEALLRDIENESDLNMDQTKPSPHLSDQTMWLSDHKHQLTTAAVSGSSRDSQVDTTCPGSSKLSESRSVRRIAKFGKRY